MTYTPTWFAYPSELYTESALWESDAKEQHQFLVGIDTVLSTVAPTNPQEALRQVAAIIQAAKEA